MPNAFSPNNDGENEYLKLFYGNMACIETFQLVIYNRWGEKVFETDNPLAQWDGYVNEKEESTALFVYFMKAILVSGEKIDRKGNISLVR